MARIRILLSLEPTIYEALKCEASRQRTLPATLAADVIANCVTGSKISRERPTATLKAWLESYLDEIRESGDWPTDVTLQVFRRIQDEALDLYEPAVANEGRGALNREIGRMVKERLGARVVTRAGRPRRLKVSPKQGSLIQLVTLLEPNRR